MKPFMNEDFLLHSETAKRLYHETAAKLPIIDYHCHIPPADIAQDRQFDNLTEIWLGGDHYKWRLIRAAGVSEDNITGKLKSDPYKVFEQFAQALPFAIGNPLYHWSHLELQRFFGVKEPLTAQNAASIYEQCGERLHDADMSAKGLIRQSNVKFIATTDDPVDDLAHHEALAADKELGFTVIPAFRPDKALGIEALGYGTYIGALGAASGIEISNYGQFIDALLSRVDFFETHGCRASDHALVHGFYAPATRQELDDIFAKALRGEAICECEAEKFRTEVLVALASKYFAYGWAMELHIGSLRGVNSKLLSRLGNDVGIDMINSDSRPSALTGLLGRMKTDGILPRTVLFSLNPHDNEALISLAGCFNEDAACPGYVQLGAAWWFNDTKGGMEKQLSDFAQGALLGSFIGMLTDSRSLLSYPRHEYFRRILCQYLGNLVDNGEYPADWGTLNQIVCDISFNNAKRYLGLH